MQVLDEVMQGWTCIVHKKEERSGKFVLVIGSAVLRLSKPISLVLRWQVLAWDC